MSLIPGLRRQRQADLFEFEVSFQDRLQSYRETDRERQRDREAWVFYFWPVWGTNQGTCGKNESGMWLVCHHTP